MTTGTKSKHRQLAQFLVSVPLLFATAGCSLAGTAARVGELRTKTESVELTDAESVQVEIYMAAGELAMSGGATELLRADFTYNVDELEPEVNYGGGTLVVRTPEASIGADSFLGLSGYQYRWELQLNETVPMEMRVQVGAGTADLHLGSLAITRLDIETGASEVTVDLSGAASLTRLDVEAGVGLVSMDLTGGWQHDLDAKINSGVGGLTLRLPREVCVRVDVEGGLGSVNAKGLAKEDSVYTNDACDGSAVTLRIEIDAGIGGVNLEVEE